MLTQGKACRLGSFTCTRKVETLRRGSGGKYTLHEWRSTCSWRFLKYIQGKYEYLLDLQASTYPLSRLYLEGNNNLIIKYSLCQVRTQRRIITIVPKLFYKLIRLLITKAALKPINLCCCIKDGSINRNTLKLYISCILHRFELQKSIFSCYRTPKDTKNWIRLNK